MDGSQVCKKIGRRSKIAQIQRENEQGTEEKREEGGKQQQQQQPVIAQYIFDCLTSWKIQRHFAPN